MDFVTLPPLTVLDIFGRDAARVLNNLCTAAVLPLNPGEGCEAFITEVRGRTLGHLCIYRLADRLRLIGAAGQAETIAAHLDRYTIREDATAEDHSSAWSGVLLDEACLLRLDPACRIDPPAEPHVLPWKLLGSVNADGPSVGDRSGMQAELRSATMVDDRSAGRSAESGEQQLGSGSAPLRSEQEAKPAAIDGAIGDDGRSAKPDSLIAYRVPWTAAGRWLVAGPAAAVKELVDELQTAGAQQLAESVFHQLRVPHRFPWFGTDLDDRNLPQEADRDALAISFTKGCYLGQETVARLDALGQVQKKLVLWRISSNQPPAAGTELSQDGRVVGRLTSVVADSAGDGYLALGFARRSHFEAGAEAQTAAENGEILRATVI